MTHAAISTHVGSCLVSMGVCRHCPSAAMTHQLQLTHLPSAQDDASFLANNEQLVEALLTRLKVRPDDQAWSCFCLQQHTCLEFLSSRGALLLTSQFLVSTQGSASASEACQCGRKAGHQGLLFAR